jgi:exodeoxyribonuclease I
MDAVKLYLFFSTYGILEPMYRPQTILWYDLETFGINSQYDRIAQYAAVRTDMDLNIIEEPSVLYCRITPDYLPDPLACLVTGITPQKTLEEGVCEAEFIAQINRELLRPGTCTAGFNSIQFDDEFIRNALYRNFHDPYQREYAGGNSRWDILNVLRAAHDFRPEGIIWPKNENDRPSFRLEKITEANAIAHEDAHDALADVYATINVARLIREQQPELYAYAYSHRQKRALKDLVQLHEQKPFLHTAAIHTTEHGCTALLMPVAADPHNSNSVLCFDLSRDPEQLLGASEEELLSNPQLTRIALNKCPFISPASVLTDEVAERLHIDKGLCREHYSAIRARKDLAGKVHSALSRPYQEQVSDPDFMIYAGGFFSDSDKDRFSIIHETPAEELLQLPLRFDDPRIPEMVWRYTCRNFPEVLSAQEHRKWLSFCSSRLLFPPGDIMVSYQFYTRKIAEKAASKDTSNSDRLILKDLMEYGRQIEKDIIKAV